MFGRDRGEEKLTRVAVWAAIGAAKRDGGLIEAKIEAIMEANGG